MEVGIVGLPLSGKTTIYNALTRSQAETKSYGAGRCEVHTAVVEVPDPRVDRLARMFHPRKTTRARIQYNDISGVAPGAGQGGLDAQVLTALSTCDALLQVVRAFRSDQVPHPAGGIDPARDLAALRLELILSDLAIVERRIERLPASIRKAQGTQRQEQEHELALMETTRETLEAEGMISALHLSPEERRLIRGYQFLTAKPALVVVNSGEDDPEPDIGLNGAAMALKGALEMEIAQLPEDEVAPFLAEYGIAEPSLRRMVRACYDLLGLMSFFTVGEDEVRAWTVRRGATAVEAAGAIHTDLARGFIRAEVIAYDDMIACGTLAEARKRGKLRLEGKEYIVQDGDILNIRFNV
jgi:GTP-binding protein YchF